MNLNDRLKKLKAKLKEARLNALLISSTSNVTYLTNFSNFTNLEREVFLFITPTKQFIITDGRYAEAVAENIRNFELLEITANSPFKDLAASLVKKFAVKSLGFEEDDLSYLEYKTLKPLFEKLVNFNIDQIRMIKEPQEVDLIEKACQIGDEAFKFILAKIKPGVKEIELAHELEYFFRKKMAEKSFEPIVGFGPHSSIPHHQTGTTSLNKKGEFVLLDFGVRYENYCSDMTRTVFYGKANEKQKSIYQTTLKAQRQAINFISQNLKTGKKFKGKEVDKVARDYIKNKGYPDIPHSLGHGIGLLVHEAVSLTPKSETVLESGMVFSIEPGIYLKGYGGVRIEDLFVMEEDKIKQLTKAPKNLIEI